MRPIGARFPFCRDPINNDPSIMAGIAELINLLMGTFAEPALEDRRPSRCDGYAQVSDGFLRLAAGPVSAMRPERLDGGKASATRVAANESATMTEIVSKNASRLG